MRLKEARERMNLRQRDVANRLKEVDSRVNTALVSRFETGVCRPTPEQLRALCSILQEQADALYTYSELDYGMKRKVKPVYTGPDTEYKMTVRVPMEVIGDPVAFKARLKDQGYASISQWVCREVQRINSIYEKKGSGTVDAATRPNDIIRSNNMRKKVNYIITRRATKVKEGHK